MGEVRDIIRFKLTTSRPKLNKGGLTVISHYVSGPVDDMTWSAMGENINRRFIFPVRIAIQNEICRKRHI